MDAHWTRRRVLGAGVAVATAAIAGCGDEGIGESTPTPTARSRQYLADFRSALEAELDIEIRDLSEDGAVVALAYDSAHETGTEDWGFEVGFAAGRYGLFASQGWETDRLDATATGTGGTTVTWHVDAEPAAAHAEGDLDTETFVSEVLDTVEEQ